MLALIALVLAVAFIIAVVRLRGSRPLPPADPSEVRRLATEGSSLQAVAMYRRLTGLGCSPPRTPWTSSRGAEAR